MGTHRPRDRERAKAIRELRLPVLLEVARMARNTFYYHLKNLELPDKYFHEKEMIKHMNMMEKCFKTHFGKLQSDFSFGSGMAV